MSLVCFFCGDGRTVQRPPGPGDVSQDEGDDEGDVGHGTQREEAGAAVGNGERALQGNGGGVIGGVVPASAEQQRQYYQHTADTTRPDGSPPPDNTGYHAPEYQENADYQRAQHGRHGQQVVQVLVLLEVHITI